MSEQMELELEWPETEERIDMIGVNGGLGLHYMDVKKQMLSQPTDMEVLQWLTTGEKVMDTFIDDDGVFNFYCTMGSPTDVRTDASGSSYVSFLDAIKEAMVND